jgi:hypothetical protein
VWQRTVWLPGCAAQRKQPGNTELNDSCACFCLTAWGYRLKRYRATFVFLNNYLLINSDACPKQNACWEPRSIRKTFPEQTSKNGFFGPFCGGLEVVREPVVLQMMTEAEVYPALHKIIGDPVRASAAVTALQEVVQSGPELERSHAFLAYAEGYKLWLQAGLGLLTSGELQEIGQSAPSIVSAFKQRIDQKGNPFRNS